MGLFDGMNPGSGILGGLADYLYPNAGGTAVNGMDFGAPGMNFADRWPAFSPSAPVAPQASQPGMSFGDRWSPIPTGMAAGTMTQGMPPMPDPGLQQVSPEAMQAWRQGADNQGMGAPGQTQMPPMAQPVSGPAPPGMPTPQPPQGGQMPSALNGLPIPQMPSMPSFGGSAQAQTAPGIGDRLGAAGAGFFNAGGPMEAIGNLIGGAVTGQRQDAQGYGRQQTQQAQQAAYQAVKSAGGSEGQALAAASSPEVFKALAPELFGGFKLVKTGSNPITGEQFMMQGPGGKLHALSEFSMGGAGGASDLPGGGGIMKPGVKYDASLPGEAYLEQFGPEMQAAAKAYLNGDAIPVGNPRLQGIAAAARTVAQTYALKMGIPFSETDYNQKRQMQMDLSKSSPNSIGGILSNGKSAFGHLANLSDKFVDLGNANGGGDYPGSAHIGAIGNYAGNVIAPSATTKGKLTAVNDNALKYGQEATKFYAGSGGGEAERMNALKTAKAETSTGIEQAAFLETEKELMLERFHQKEAQVRDRLGQEYLDKHPIATPELEATIKKIDANIARLRGGSATGSAPAASARAPLAGFKVLKVQ